MRLLLNSNFICIFDMQHNGTRYCFIGKMASNLGVEVLNLADVFFVMLVF